MLRIAACLCASLLVAHVALAQNEHRIEGTVTDASDRTGIPGVNVVLKGTTLGSVTDASGRYSIQVPNGNGVLVFSFVGYASQEVEIGMRNTISVALTQEATQISEVVVTALGIEREKQSLGYATQEIKGDNLNEAREGNFTSMLAGKVAGLDIKTNAGVGSSTRVILRGEGSLSFDQNQPLFIVDGVPINNGTSNSSADFGNGASEINPADIESVNVLKGPAAAALYGSRAANGVIMITTKSGKGARGIGISVNSGMTFEEPLRLPRFQNEFGQGNSGLFEGSNFGYQGNLDAMPNGVQDGYDESWGPRLNYGPKRAQFDSPTTNGYRGGDVHVADRGDVIPTPWISQPNNVRDFFDLGRTVFNNIALTGGNEKSNFRLSLTQNDQKGLVPNNNLQRGGETEIIVGVQHDEAQPAEFSLYPNPTNESSVTLRYELPVPSDMKLTMVNKLGVQMGSWLYERSSQGVVTVNTSYEPGLYFLLIEAHNFRKTLKLMVVK